MGELLGGGVVWGAGKMRGREMRGREMRGRETGEMGGREVGEMGERPSVADSVAFA